MFSQTALILTALPVFPLLYAVYSDLTRREIDHWVVISIALSAPLFWWAAGVSLVPHYAWGQHPWFQLASIFDPPSVVTIVALAALVFLVMLFFFAIGWMGGGDVKLYAAVALWLLPWELPVLFVVEVFAGLAVTVAAYAHHKIKQHQGQVEVPRGVAIAFAGIWVLVERYFNHFGG